MSKKRLAPALTVLFLCVSVARAADAPRERVSINADWRFIKGDPQDNTMDLTYMIRPPVPTRGRGRGAAPVAPASRPTTPSAGIYPWVMPSGNAFLAEAQHFARPQGNLGAGVSYILPAMDDSAWRHLDLPHDWGVEGPFIAPGQPGSEGATGRLPYFGKAWYRKHLDIPAADAGKQLFLDIDGAMSYSLVWLNGQFVGGWPYGYSSYRLNLTPYARPGGENVLAIRLDNPENSSRWYPGGGIYRNVWLTKTNPVHIAQSGTTILTRDVSAGSATVVLKVAVESPNPIDKPVDFSTDIFAIDREGRRTGPAVATFAPVSSNPIPNGMAEKTVNVETQATLRNPKLWSPNSPNRYVAVTTIKQANQAMDVYETPFGIRTVKLDSNQGLFLNGEHIKLYGVCEHHDFGALGSAFNMRAMERKLEILKEMGCNAIRTSHNPPAPELLELTDRMGFLVMDEAFDTWRNEKRPNDYHLLFNEWSEQDLRALIRRDRNHPSIVLWSIGNEITEQSQADGAPVAQRLVAIVHEEDPSRQITAACHASTPGGAFAAALDAVGNNYERPRVPEGAYVAFHKAAPNQFIIASETVSTVSSRGEYTFPVAATNEGEITGNRGNRLGNSTLGQDTENRQMSSYDLYYPNWATTPDTEFAMQERDTFVGGEFVWTGFDYLGEPTPWDGGNNPSRSSYFGIIDLAGFPKDRFYLYQAHWRPDFPMVHILPHWNWAERVGQVTPVHVYTSGDEAELFLNGKSQGRRKKGAFEYRLRWDDVVYEPGEVRVIAYKAGKQWASETVKTTGPAAKLLFKADRTVIAADGKDLSFITLTVADAAGMMVPRSKQPIHFDITGPGEIIATDNGDATDHTAFASKDRKAFNGLALAIVKAKAGQAGTVTITAKSEGLVGATTTVTFK